MKKVPDQRCSPYWFNSTRGVLPQSTKTEKLSSGRNFENFVSILRPFIITGGEIKLLEGTLYRVPVPLFWQSEPGRLLYQYKACHPYRHPGFWAVSGASGILCDLSPVKWHHASKIQWQFPPVCGTIKALRTCHRGRPALASWSLG